MEKYTEYQFFMFSQIMMLKLRGTDAEFEPYDLLYPIFKAEMEKFLESEYNNENKSEHDCMVDYLWAHSDRISLTIADHCNI
jgi:hypothetical protein